MRGKPVDTPRDYDQKRITPAHAGKTEDLVLTQRRIGGSPPRMRGKHADVTDDFKKIRITPAHAGKTRCCDYPRIKAWDHPRACGENSAMVNSVAINRGSPPRMRGKLDRRITVGGLARITPAHAGKTGIKPGTECAV